MDLTPELLDTMLGPVVEAVAAGAPRRAAARAHGVSTATYQRWCALGAKGAEPYAAWLEALDGAEARAEVSLITALHGTKDTRTVQWILERLNPDRWGAKLQVDVVRQHTELLTVAEETLPPAWFDALLAAYEGRVAGESARRSEGEAGRAGSIEDRCH